MEQPVRRTSRLVPWSTLATVGFSYFAVGVTVSLALADRGVAAATIFTAGLLIFSATSELAYLAARDGGAGQAAAVLSGWLVASRFGLLATALSTRFGGSATQRTVAAICAFDPNVAIAVEQSDPRRVRRAFWEMTTAMMVGWWVGSAAGIVVGNVVADTGVFGLDAVLPAALLAIIGPMLRRTDGRIAAIVGAVVCLALTPFAPSGLPILASSLGAIGAIAFTRPSDRTTRDAAP